MSAEAEWKVFFEDLLYVLLGFASLDVEPDRTVMFPLRIFEGSGPNIIICQWFLQGFLAGDGKTQARKVNGHLGFIKWPSPRGHRI